MHCSFFVLLTEREPLSDVRVSLRSVFTPSTMRRRRTVPLPLQEVEACACASLIFCFTDREGTPARRESKFAIRIYPFHRCAVPLPLQEVEAYSCALLIVLFTIREKTLERCKKECWSTDGRLPLVRGAGSPQARLRGLTRVKSLFS